MKSDAEAIEEYRSRPPTDFLDFVGKITAPLYTWRMAFGCKSDTGPARVSADKRMTRAQEKIDDLVVEYAIVVLKKRREKLAEWLETP